MVSGEAEPQLQQVIARVGDGKACKAVVWEKHKWEHLWGKGSFSKKSLLKLIAPLPEGHHLETSK